MDYFSGDGMFWLPDRPDERIPGTLTFDADGGTLQLHGTFQAEPPNGIRLYSLRELQEVPVVHGRLHDGREVTLLYALGVGGAGLSLTTEEVWRVEFLLTGGHVSDNVFDQALFDFDALMAWTRPPAIVTESPDSLTVEVNANRATIVETGTDDGTRVRLLAGVVGRQNGRHVHLDQYCCFETTGNVRGVRKILDDWVRPLQDLLQDLLIVCLGRPVLLTSLSVRLAEAGRRNSLLTVSFRAMQPEPRKPPTEMEIDGYDASTLIARWTSPTSLEELVSTWFATWKRLRDAIALLCGPFYAPFIYGEHRYASTFQAAEALARELVETKEMMRTEHQKRVDLVSSALRQASISDDMVSWATRVLRSRNDKPLPELIKELARSTGGIGGAILESVPGFPKAAVSARVGVSHGGADRSDVVLRHWLGEALGWIVRVRLLVEAGVPLNDLVTRTVRRPRFSRLLTELSERV